MALASKQRIVANIRSFLGWCFRSGRLPADLSAHLPLPRLPKPLPRDIPSLKEIAQLIRSQRAKATPIGCRNAALVCVLFACGLRRAECAALRIDDLDLAQREVRVTSGKGGRGRVTVIAPWAAKVVEEYLGKGRPGLAAQDSTNRLFLLPSGRPLPPHQINRLFPLLCEDAGIRREIKPHALRHAFCLALLRGGASIRVVAALAGHRIGQTSRYTPLTNADLAKVVARAHPRGKRP